MPVHDTEREILRELIPIAGQLAACFGWLYEAVAGGEAAGVPDPDLKSALARVKQSCDKTNDVMLKVARLQRTAHRGPR